jgi:mono/diheme cytochrome c family protein
MNEMEVPVTKTSIHPDGKGVDIDLAELLPDYVYEVSLNGVQSIDGTAVVHSTGYYTANHLLAGSGFSAGSSLVAKPSAPRAPDLAAGEIIFKANCVVCHQADGRGSRQIGTPDFTLTGGPLSLPDAPLINQITNGGKVMPAFGHVLATQEILDVLAFVRQAFAPGKSAGATH